MLDPDSGEIIAEFAIEAGARLGGCDFTGTYLSEGCPPPYTNHQECQAA